MDLSATTERNISGNEQAAVAQMFDRIARRYDFLNHLLSLHIDKMWRRKAVNQLRGLTLNHVLDVATGTADLAIAIQKRGNSHSKTTSTGAYYRR